MTRSSGAARPETVRVSYKYRLTPGIQVTFADDAVPPAYHDKVISTLYSDTLHRICPSGSLPSLSPASPSSPGAVTIGVAGLQSSDTSRDSVQLAPAEEGGFGYLIPRSARLDANPHMALGVLFDSNVTTLIDAEPVPLPPDLLDQAGPESGGEDNAVVHLARHFLEAQQRQEEALAADPKRGTRLTVMLGGHWWGDSRSSEISGESKDVADHLIEAAKQTVHLQLGIEPSSWTSAAAVLATACIPQPRVGHFGAMAALHAELLSAFHGRVAVAGPSYVGVGVLGCLRAGRDAAMAVARSTVGDGMYSGEEDVWVEAEKETVAHVGETGLAEFVPGKDGEAPEVSRPLVVAADRVFGKRGLKW